MLIVLTASFLILYAIFFLYCKPSVLYVLFAFEIILLGTNFIFAQNSYDMDDLYGQGVALILFSAAAVDTSIGLIIIVNLFNIYNIDIKELIRIYKDKIKQDTVGDKNKEINTINYDA